MTHCTSGWIEGETRRVECWSAPPGRVLRVDGGHDVYIAPDGATIVRVVGSPSNEKMTFQPVDAPVTELDRAILSGPALVLALALRSVWCLHASAAIYQDQLVAFLGESGQGKSTLAAYLAQAGAPGWQLAADDILPATLETDGLLAWLHFPQLKLPAQAQPGLALPESLPLQRICLLAETDADSPPTISRLSSALAMQAILRHTAGTRLFDPPLLEKHLQFSAQAAMLTPVYQLSYPRCWESLPAVARELENLW